MSTEQSTTQSPNTEPPPTPPENPKPPLTPEETVRRILEQQAGLNLAMGATALQSIRDGVQWEANMIREPQQDGEGGLASLGQQPQKQGEQEMGPVVIGDVSYHHPAQPTQPQPQQDHSDLLEMARIAAQAGRVAAPVAATGIDPWWLAVPTVLALLSGGAALWQTTKTPPEPNPVKIQIDPPPKVEIPGDGNTKYSMEFAEPRTQVD